jgi:hypothetical protein
MSPSLTASGLGELMLAYASQNMTHDLLLQESNKLEGLSSSQRGGTRTGKRIP